MRAPSKSPPRRELSSNSSIVKQSSFDNRVRVVVRIRPMNAQEKQKGSRTVIRTAVPVCDDVIRSLSPNDTGSVTSLSSLKSSSTISSAKSFASHGRKLLSSIRVSKKKSDEEEEAIVVGEESYEETAKLVVSFPAICHAEISNTKMVKLEFDAVFGPDTTQEQIYSGAVGNMITKNIKGGYNTTILAYGQTGSGKTHTMSCADGVVAKAVQDIFKVTKRDGTVIEVSCLEIYSDEMRDLLGDASLRLRDQGEMVSVVGLRQIQVESVEQVQELLQKATERRLTGATNLNANSSRSHAIYTITISEEKDGTKQSAKLTLVDLAGSERITKTGVQGLQRKESININKDLFSLGKVVSSLSQKGFNHIPYRDSKLTRLLKDALGGNCCTLLIACVSPADAHADESLNTLRYAERTRSITNNAKPNVSGSSILTSSEVSALQMENRVLRARVANLTRRVTSSSNDSTSLFTGRSFGSEFPGLEIKLRRAKEEVQATMDSCRSVTSMADRVKHHRLKGMERKPSKTQSSGKDPNGTLSRIFSLIEDKIAMCDQIVELGRQTEEKNTQLEQAVRDGHHQSQIRKDVSQLRQMIRNLAGDLKENEECLQSLLVTLRGDPLLTTDQQKHAGPLNRVQRHQLEIQCKELRQDLDFVSSENDILRHQNKRLQTELIQLRSQASNEIVGIESYSSTVSIPTEGENFGIKMNDIQHSGPAQIRSRAEELLNWADKAIEKGQSDRSAGEDSTLGTMLRPRSSPMSRARSRKDLDETESTLIISNIDHVEVVNPCVCEKSMFTQNPEHVDFYLPQLRLICDCKGKAIMNVADEIDPSSLFNILRKWQADFLQSMGIETALQLIESYSKRSKGMAKEMQRWRRENGLFTVRAKSCRIALHIWSRTCKRLLKAMVKGDDCGISSNMQNILEFSMSDSRSISTIGFETEDHLSINDDLDVSLE